MKWLQVSKQTKSLFWFNDRLAVLKPQKTCPPLNSSYCNTSIHSNLYVSLAAPYQLGHNCPDYQGQPQRQRTETISLPNINSPPIHRHSWGTPRFYQGPSVSRFAGVLGLFPYPRFFFFPPAPPMTFTSPQRALPRVEGASDAKARDR